MKTTIVCFALAILLGVGLHIPVLTSFIAMGVIYLVHVVSARMGTGVDKVLSWIKSIGNVLMGLVIFLSIRFLAAKALGLYPLDSYETLDDSGGLYWILLGGHDVSTRLLWELMFAFVAGQITVMWVKGTHKFPVRAIIVSSLIIITLQIAYPEYMATWATKHEVATNLENRGWVGSAWHGTGVLLFGKDQPKQSPQVGSQANVYNAPPQAPEPPKLRALTPATLTLDYGFSLEADAPIMVQYPGEKPFLFNPRKSGDCQPLPQPRNTGPKNFWDPDNPTNGHVSFRIYRGKGTCE